MKINDLYEDGSEQLSDKQIQRIKDTEWFKNGVVFYRGVNLSIPSVSEFTISKERQRKPLDFNIDTHNEINKLSTEKFGYPIRNGLFLYSHLDTRASSYYGKIMAVFPDGNNKFFYADGIEDLYGDYHSKLKSKDIASEYIGLVKELEVDTEYQTFEIMGFGDFIMVDYDIAVRNGLIAETEIIEVISWEDYKQSVYPKFNIAIVQEYLRKFGIFSKSLIEDVVTIIENHVGNFFSIFNTIGDMKLYTNSKILDAIFKRFELLKSMCSSGRFVSYIVSNDLYIKRMASVILENAGDTESEIKKVVSDILMLHYLLNIDYFKVRMLKHTKQENYNLYKHYYERLVSLNKLPKESIDKDLEHKNEI